MTTRSEPPRDRHGHWLQEPLAEADYTPAGIAFQAAIAARRGQSVNLDTRDRLRSRVGRAAPAKA